MEALIWAKRPAVVVAHPDDEALWCGGLLLRHPKNWDVVCCSVPERDPERAELFFRSCAALNANPVLIRQPETKIDFNKLDLAPYDLIVTHNRDGEYGHRQHKEVHQFCVDKFPEKTICFGYRPKRGSSGSAFEIVLTPDECKKKMAAIQCYDNTGSSNRPTWTMLLEAFAPKFNLWIEPYEWPI